MDRVLSYIELGKEEGATLIAGGKARPDKGGGYFIEPTCFLWGRLSTNRTFGRTPREGRFFRGARVFFFEASVLS